MVIADIFLGLALIALGLSFVYKCFLAVFFGRTSYWTGFLPFGIFSPLFIHWPPGKRSLIKTIHGWWIHITLGPIFFLCALLCIAGGLDRIGFNGTEICNYVLTMQWLPNAPSSSTSQPAIVYSKSKGYEFPILKRMHGAIVKLLTGPVVPEKKGETIMGEQKDEGTTTK